MILKRKIYSKLLNWKNECQGTKAIMVEGAGDSVLDVGCGTGTY